MKLKELFILLFFHNSVYNCSINGKNYSNEDNYPLEYATVALYRNNIKLLVTGSRYDKDGRFLFLNKTRNLLFRSFFIRICKLKI